MISAWCRAVKTTSQLFTLSFSGQVSPQLLQNAQARKLAGTCYAGGCFKVKMQMIPATYPTQPPRCTFVTKAFHPNLHAQTGEICLNTLKRDW